MPALYPYQSTFVRGEISPRLHARADLDLYRAGLSRCENFLTLPHGGIRKRGGTYFCGEVKTSTSPVRLIPFIFSADQAYCLEFGEYYFRVYAYGSRVGTVEVVSPYTAAQLDDVQFVQSADVMWLTHPSHPVYLVTRTGHTSWSIAAYPIYDGPFAARNSNGAITADISAITGTGLTITANSAIFAASDVGRLFRIEMPTYEDVVPWEPHAVMGASGFCRYEGRIYGVIGGGATDRFGTTPPTHTSGVWPDGTKETDSTFSCTVGVDLEYLNSGFGVALITAYVDTTHVTATVISRFPEQVVTGTGTSYIWSFGAFTSGNYPASTTLFEERLALGTKLSVYASRTGAFDQFETGPAGDDALEFLNAANEANDIVWLSGTDGFLAIGTIGGIRALSGSGIDEALTPTSFKNRKSRTYGCSNIRPVDAGSSFLYVTRSRMSIAELAVDQAGRFTSEDVGQISEHIPKRGVVEIAFQQDPDPTLWFPLENGELGAYTHQPSQEVRGMSRHIVSTLLGLPAVVERCIVTPGQNGVDDVWIVVRRTIGGVTKRFIEILKPAFEYDTIADAFCVDSGLQYSGVAVGTVSGLNHLNGQLVSVLADGRVYSLTVSANAVTLPASATASKWSVGLPYAAHATTLELDVGGRDGSRIGRRKKVAKVILALLETDLDGLEVASRFNDRWEPVRLPTTAAASTTRSLYTGNVPVDVEDSWEGQCRIRIAHSGPGPCTVIGATIVFDGEP